MSIFYRILISLSCLLFISRPDWLYAQSAPISENEIHDPCVVEWIATPQNLPPLGALTNVSGDQLTQTQKDQFTLVGQARLSQPGLVLLSDQLFYDRNQQMVRAFGAVELHQTDAILLGSLAEFNQTNQSGFVNDVVYQFSDSRAHGEAQRIEFSQQTRISELNKASFTTCPLNDQAWYIAFNKLEINDPKRRLYGYHSTLYFKDVPVLYTPYIDFPLDDRASGLLFPTFGSHKNAAQTNPLGYLSVPYYFNIAPNMDDTLSVMMMEQRGLVLDNEFRYLQPNHRGELRVAALHDQLTAKQGMRYVKPNGELATDAAITDRWRMSFNGQQTWAKGLTSDLVWHDVSDPDFYNDVPLSLSDSQSINKASYLNRHVKLNYRQGPVQAHIQHYGYLPLRNAALNYEKHPEIGLNVGQSFGNWRLNLYSEATEFTLPEASTRVIGTRLVTQPSLQYQLHKPYGHLQAQVKANYREYNLTNNDPLTLDAQSSNTVMQYALRGGLVFERDLNLFGRDFIQTLEPELQYLHVPFVNQGRLPIFDTAAASLDFSNLFQLNRFSGVDRIGDTQQITAALTTKLLTHQGEPLADAAIGQIVFLADRQVGLSTSQVDATERSDYFVKLGLTLDKFYLSSNARFDSDTQALSNLQNRLRWNAAQRLNLLAVHQALNINHADPSQRTNTLASGLVVKLGHQWEFASYINYDIEQQQRRETATGLRYDSCCWASELIFEEAQLADGRYNYGVKYVIEFKGLSTLGNRLRDTIDKTLNF